MSELFLLETFDAAGEAGAILLCFIAIQWIHWTYLVRPMVDYFHKEEKK